MTPGRVGKLVFGAGLLALVLIGFSIFSGATGGFGYFNHEVKSDEVGIRFVRNQPTEVLGPGVYTDWSPGNALTFQFKHIENIRVQGIPFRVDDAEVLTKDMQRLGVYVQGQVLRPGVGQASTLLNGWATYKQFYTDDKALIGIVTKVPLKDEKGAPVKDANGKDVLVDRVTTQGLMQDLGAQAVKVCVGDKPFNESVIGSARDVLRECIIKELGIYAGGYGLTVQNIVVPNFVLSPEVQKQLDSITQARLATDVANQRALQNKAEAEQNAAKEKGAILVEQSKVQERATQDALTAKLQVTALEAQRQQIEAEKANALLAAQKDKDISEAKRQAALLQAQADVAQETMKARMLQENPAYVDLQKTQAMSAALKSTDKVYVVPPGTNPITFVGGSSQPVIISPATSTAKP